MFKFATEQGVTLMFTHLTEQEILRVFDYFQDGCYILNERWEFIYMNRSAEPLMDKSMKELLGSNFWKVLPWYIHTSLYELYHKAKLEHSTQYFEVKSEYSDSWFNVIVYPLQKGICVIFQDITEQKQQEKEKDLLDKSRMAGEIAAGVAHEVRNPMTAIRGYLQLMSQNKDMLNYAQQFKLMITELDRANEIITEFLNVAKSQSSMLAKHDLNFVIRGLLSLLQSEAIKQTKVLDVHLGYVSHVFLDKNEIRQLVLNLVMNAFEAMSNNQRATISTYEEQDKIILTIQDQGKGIDPAIIDDLGTPFVTTKEGGTGLGLSICYSIVRRNNATIDVKTGSEGTRFIITFPRAT